MVNFIELTIIYIIYIEKFFLLGLTIHEQHYDIILVGFK